MVAVIDDRAAQNNPEQGPLKYLSWSRNLFLQGRIRCPERGLGIERMEMEGPDTGRLFRRAGGGEERGKEVRKSQQQLTEEQEETQEAGFC